MNASTRPRPGERVGNTPIHHTTRKATRAMTNMITGDAAPVATHSRLRQADPLTPFAAGLHRMAAFITTHRLPTADVAFLAETGVVVDVTGLGLHVEGAVRQWAKALNTTVSEHPEVSDGRLFRYFEARGYTEDVTFVRVVGRQLVTEAGAR